MAIILTCAITNMLECFITWYYCAKVFDSKYTRVAEFCGAAVSFCILFAVSLLQSIPANVSAFLVITWLYIWIFFQMRWFSALFHAFLLTTMMNTTETFVSLLIPNQLFQIYDNASTPNLVFIVFTSKLLYFLILRFITILICSKNQAELLGYETISLCIIPFCSILVGTTLAIIPYSMELSHSMILLVAISFVALLIINLVIGEYYSYSQKKHLELTSLQLQLQKENDAVEYYQLLLKQEEDKSILIHDIKKHLHSISSIIDTQSSQTATNYIKQLLQSPVLQSSTRVCDHDTVNAIFGRYQKLCQMHHIQLEVDIRGNTLSFMNDRDITSLFCNLLDNAMEANNSYPDGFISCSVIHKKGTPFVVITMRNSCKTAPAMNGDNRILSIKKNSRHHGFGLKSIERVTHRYHGHMKVYFNSEDNTFHSIVTLDSEKPRIDTIED